MRPDPRAYPAGIKDESIVTVFGDGGEQQAEVFNAVTGGKRLVAALRTLAADGAARSTQWARPVLDLVLQRLGEILRFEGELADDAHGRILVVTSALAGAVQWWAHARIASGRALATMFWPRCRARNRRSSIRRC